MTTWGPWQEYAPGSDVQDFQSGLQLGSGIAQQISARHQRQQEINMEKERLAAEEHQLQVNEGVAQQRQALAAQAVARSTQATLDYQNAIKGGMDPVKAAMMYGPAMSGGRMTGYAPLFTGWERANAPQLPPVDARPVTDPNTGKVVGYQDKNGHVSYIPQPRVAPVPKPTPDQYNTITDHFPAVKGTRGSPAIPSDATWWKPLTWLDKATPAVPAVPGSPARTVTHRELLNPPAATAAPDAPPLPAQLTPGDQAGMRGGYSHPNEVGAALAAKQIDRDTAEEILRAQFGME